jgi:hypothetical protein
MFFNGFTLLLCVLSFMAGVVWLHNLDKAIRKHDAKVREAQRKADNETDTPIYAKLSREWDDWKL